MAAIDFVPDSSGYSATPLDQVVGAATQGGFPRERKDLLDATFMVSCQFTFGKPKEYEAFMTFYTTYKEAPYWLEIMLVTDITDPTQMQTLHKAQFVPGSVGLSTFGGWRWVVKAQLEAYKV